MDALKAKLQKIVDDFDGEETPDDFCSYDHFGGNMDDAYNGGLDEGEETGRYLLAVELLKMIESAE